MATAKLKASNLTVQMTKNGPNGRPLIEASVVGAADLGAVGGALSSQVLRNTDILKKLGLKACPGCISGADIWIRHRFDDVINVKIG